MNWFEKLTGFTETSPLQVRQNITVHGELLTSKVNGKSYVCGVLKTPSLDELRQKISSCVNSVANKISLKEIVADVQQLHADPLNKGALFQVASQFNLLEMVSPRVTPEQGIGIYEYDHTQGPACAIAAGAGTMYRNYFAQVNGQIGQTEDNQIDCLFDLGSEIGNADAKLWQMKNGYALPSKQGIAFINEHLKNISDNEIDNIRKRLRIGIQSNTQVTLHNCSHLISQTYCSALPVAYSEHSPSVWENFARLVLEAAYEATLCAGILNADETGNKTVYMTLLGGGAFGNKPEWIFDAITRAVKLYQHADLELIFVSYGKSNPELAQVIKKLNEVVSR